MGCLHKRLFRLHNNFSKKFRPCNDIPVEVIFRQKSYNLINWLLQIEILVELLIEIEVNIIQG